MDAQIDGQKDRWMDEQMCGQMDGLDMDRQIDKLTDGQTDELIDGQMSS